MWQIEKETTMQITFTARHFKAPDNLRQYSEKEVLNLLKHSLNIVVCDIVLVKEKINKIAEITIKASNIILSAKETSEDFFKSIDLTVNKLERQLKKYKEKARQHSHDKINDVLRDHELLEEETN